MDHLIGLKENVIIGRLIPAGTGMKCYSDVKLNTDVEEDDELIFAEDADDEEMDDVLTLAESEDEEAEDMETEEDAEDFIEDIDADTEE